MSMACRSCGVNAISVRCLHCMEDRALMCLSCARHHNEIKQFQNHELVPLGNNFHGVDPRNDPASNPAFRQSSGPSPSMSQMAMAQREEQQRPPYRGLTSRLGPGGPGGPGAPGPSPGMMMGPGGPGAGVNPPHSGPTGVPGPGAYPSNIRNKVCASTAVVYSVILW